MNGASAFRRRHCRSSRCSVSSPPGRALWSRAAGLIAALTLMTMFEWARAATGARVDMTLTFGLQLAFLSLLFFLRSRAAGWLIPLYVGITLAVLGKGPVGVALPGLVALVMLALTRDLSFLAPDAARLRRAGRRRRGGQLVRDGADPRGLGSSSTSKSWRRMSLRSSTTRISVAGTVIRPAICSARYCLACCPGRFFSPVWARGCGASAANSRRHDPRLYLLVWIAVVFGFYAVAASKRGVYLLALYPAVALLLGWWWDEQASRTRRGGTLAGAAAPVLRLGAHRDCWA